MLAAYIVGIAVGEIILFTIIRYICILRNYLVLRFMKHASPETALVEESVGKYNPSNSLSSTRMTVLVQDEKTSAEQV